MIKTISELGRSYLEKPIKKHTLKTIRQLCQTLLNRKGEASGTALAKDVVDTFNRMSEEERRGFLKILTEEFGPDAEAISEAAGKYLEARDFDSMQVLARSLNSPRADLIRMINFAPGGIAAIIKMRELVLSDLKQDKTFLPLEADLFRLLSSWFNRGFLDFQQINWDTPAAILEKIIAYEAVHEIKDWRDLRRRLAEDRSCFAFFHPALHHEPLIFVQVAFTKGIARKIQPLLSEAEGEVSVSQADTAIFYSISNAQTGLKGISFGNFLIKQVVDHISKKMPEIKTYSTLSPIPKFRKWLEKYYIHRKDSVITEEEKAQLLTPNWFENEKKRKQLMKTLTRVCALYLVLEKKGQQPYDPVTRFHLGNGAEIENINWEADVSEHGIEQSFGLMVNYKYTPTHIVSNHEAYVNEGKICYSSKVKKLLE
ncbi:MAG: malonyl-CoA decarboxylase [Proteobacteria bacterium]|nr:malonyl-CoA decarboxylase [Pseudomonadota bacterium]